MKITYVFQNISINYTEPSAAQSHIFHIVKSLQKRGHDARLLTLQGRRVILAEDLDSLWTNRDSDENSTLMGITSRKPYLILESGVRRCQRIIHAPYFSIFDSHRIYDSILHNLKHCDVIHERFSPFSIGSAIASKRIGLPYVLEINADGVAERDFKGTPDRGLRRKYAIWSTKFNTSCATKIVSVSNQLKEHLVKNWSVPAEKIYVLPNAADVNAFSANFDKRMIRNKLNLGDEPVIVFVGGFFPWHDLSLLLSSFKRVLVQVPSAKLLLIGDGMTRPLINKEIVEKGIQDSVIMTGSVPHNHVPELISIADVAVAPFLKFFNGLGGSPLKLFEYMAANKAIVTTNTGQVSEIINDGENGLLVNSGDIQGFTEAIIFLLRHPEERARIGMGAYRQAIERHSWESYVEELEKIYLSILH